MSKKTCKDCLHYKVCQYHIDEETTMTTYECDNFADSSEWVNLPCKVGDIVYQVDSERIYESTVRNIIYDTDGIAFDERAIGKSVFLTREEAEKALEERRKEDKGNERSI